MKICLISAYYNPYVIGGGEVYLERVVNKLSRDHEIIVITTKSYSGISSFKPDLEVQNNIKIYRFYPLNIYHGFDYPKKATFIKPVWHLINLWNPHVYFIIKKILKKEEPDVVHTHNINISTSTFSAINSLKLTHIHTLHSNQLLSLSMRGILVKNGIIIQKFNYFDRRLIDIKRYLSKSVDMVISPSKFILDMHLEYGFFKNAKQVVLPLGVELNNTEKSKKKYSIIDILYVGGLSKHKGVHILIKAFKEIKNKNMRLHILGSGADTDEFKKIATDSRIVFHGFKTGEELMVFYKKANVVVVPSICYDNSPMVIYESFMNGTPVIGSRIGGIPELVEDGYNGFLFEAGNVDELKSKLEELMKNASELKKLEDYAFESAKKYVMDVHIKKLEKIYEAAMEKCDTEGIY